MSGHSKWSTIKRKKEKTDSQRAAVFTKIGRELSVAVKESGADPDANFKLRDCIAKAKASNVPNDNIERIIKKAAGSDAEEYESITYEGYGPSGVAIIVETLTDNRNRTAANIRHYFSKCGGNLGTTGCVSFMFSKQGMFVIDSATAQKDQLEEDAIMAGATDFKEGEDCFIIYTEPADYENIYQYLKDKKYEIITSEIGMIPNNYTSLSEEESAKVQTLFDVLEDDDDVQNVYHNLAE